jgi:hypothetical protein
MYLAAFGSNPSMWGDLAPITRAPLATSSAAATLVTRGGPQRVAVTQTFADALGTADVKVTVHVVNPLSHADTQRLIGEPDETVMTPIVDQWLDTCVLRIEK